MDIVEEIDQVVITMSPDEFATFRRTYQSAWNFVRHAFMKALEPQGRTFGGSAEKTVVMGNFDELKDSESKRRIEALESKVSWIQESAGEAQNEIERRVADLEGHITEMGFEALIGRVRRLEAQTQFETSEDDARIKALERQIVDIEGHVVKLAMDLSEVTDRLDTYGVPVVGRPKDVSPIEFLKRARGIEKQTLNTAEDRVRRYMAGHWSHASVEGVVAALRGGVEPLKQNSTA
jgi:hypothetical protein